QVLDESPGGGLGVDREAGINVVGRREECAQRCQPRVLTERGRQAGRVWLAGEERGRAEHLALFEAHQLEPGLPPPRRGVGRIVRAVFFLTASKESEWVPPFPGHGQLHLCEGAALPDADRGVRIWGRVVAS